MVQNFITIMRFCSDVQTPAEGVKVPFILQSRVGSHFSLDAFLETSNLLI